MEKNGEPVAFGAGAAVLGHPAAAIAMLANHLGACDEEIPAGTLILSGGITEAVPRCRRYGDAACAGHGQRRHALCLREHEMPFAQIYMIEGRTEEQKRAVIEKVTEALVEAVGARARTCVCGSTTCPRENWGIAGRSAKELGR